MTTTQSDQQVESGGISAVVRDALAMARPSKGLTWLDVGCGTGNLLRRVRDEFEPARLAGMDILDWLDDDLRADVEMRVGAAEELLDGETRFDRVMMVEVIEHLEAPWTVLRKACRHVEDGGLLVVTTPNVTSLRHRLELATRGTLTAFRPDHPPHLTPALPHVTAAIMRQEGLHVGAPSFAGVDMLPKLPNRNWPSRLARKWPQLAHTSVMLAGERPASA